MTNVRVMIADDYAAMRAALARALQTVPGLEVVGEVADGYAAVRRAEELRPDVVLMDINMPGLDGIEATRRITRRDPDVKVIGLSVHCFEFYARRMLDAGAFAYVLKDADLQELIEAIGAVRRGQTYVSPEVVGFKRLQTRPPRSPQLSRVG